MKCLEHVILEVIFKLLIPTWKFKVQENIDILLKWKHEILKKYPSLEGVRVKNKKIGALFYYKYLIEEFITVRYSLNVFYVVRNVYIIITDEWIWLI